MIMLVSVAIVRVLQLCVCGGAIQSLSPKLPRCASVSEHSLERLELLFLYIPN